MWYHNEEIERHDEPSRAAILGTIAHDLLSRSLKEIKERHFDERGCLHFGYRFSEGVRKTIQENAISLFRECESIELTYAETMNIENSVTAAIDAMFSMKILNSSSEDHDDRIWLLTEELAIPDGYHLSRRRTEMRIPKLCQGYCDCMVIRGRVAAVIDYKHGAIPVFPKNNAQLLTYTLAEHFRRIMFKPARSASLGEAHLENSHLGILTFDDVLFINMVIQPNSFDGIPVKTEYFTFEQVKAFAARLENTIERILYGSSYMGYFKAGPHCNWCPHLSTCPLLCRKVASLFFNEDSI